MDGYDVCMDNLGKRIESNLVVTVVLLSKLG